ncbi:hypothetical protein Goshw_023592 [Gossypium schwendimanii]|uniref:Mitochondrial transcription termination factor family protein n=1 Tax=Gossypium schwendimanii TaxID=34291 RepID=A0A7J9KTY6_GOSSC|nr:hypothetical protein [Gossypium schwendimanii]
MNLLRGIGVPESNILMLLNHQPRPLLYDQVRLKEIVEEVKRMGFDSSTKKFIDAVIALSSMSKSTLEKKFDVYRRWGWSDQEIHEAFQRYPMCMAVSEDKIMAVMDFLVNKMGYSSTLVAKQSSILRQSLEKRIVPRALFARELLSQGFTVAGTELQFTHFPPERIQISSLGQVKRLVSEIHELQFRCFISSLELVLFMGGKPLQPLKVPIF